MSIKVRHWLKSIRRGTRSKKNKLPKKDLFRFEQLEPRMLLSGSSVLDQTTLNNLLSSPLAQNYTVISQPLTDTDALAGSANLTSLSSPLALTQTVVPLDTVIFGDTTSENAHGFSQTYSQVITGGLSQPARKLLPIDATNDVYGGDMTFTMTVDPVQRNYFTVKLWGNDDTNISIGRLYLYVPDSQFTPDSTDYWQVGYRHEGDDVGALSVATSKPAAPG
jgi:hypothetical protein